MLSTRNDTAHSTLGEKSNKMSISLMASAMAQDESDEFFESCFNILYISLERGSYLLISSVLTFFL